MLRLYTSDCGSWPRSGDTSAVGAWADHVMKRKKLYSIYSEEMLMVRPRNRRKRGARYAHRWLCPMRSIGVDHSTSCQMRSAIVAASASYALWMTLAVNA
jgi:hypothetical protein